MLDARSRAPYGIPYGEDGTGPEPPTRDQLFRLVPDDAAAEKWLIKQRWPDGIACPHWASMRVQTGAKHKTMPFRCRDCCKRCSMRTDTVMQASNPGLQVWVVAMYLMAINLKGVSSLKSHPLPFVGLRRLIGTLAGGRAKKRRQLTGRGGADKTAVVGVHDRTTSKVRATVAERCGGETLRGFIDTHTAGDATVYPDETAAYNGLASRESAKP